MGGKQVALIIYRKSDESMSINDMKAILQDYLIMNGYRPEASYMIKDELQMDAFDEFGAFRLFRISPRDVISTFVTKKMEWVKI